MDKIMTQAMAEAVEKFRLPRFSEMPNMGLYLEQTTKYINQCLEPLNCIQVTSSMIRNYVKMGLVKNPDHKQYYAGHIAHLISITILKSVLSLESIKTLFQLQYEKFSDETAYDYFCMEMENVLRYRFGVQEQLEQIGDSVSAEKTILHSAIEAVSHVIYLNACFDWVELLKTSEKSE